MRTDRITMNNLFDEYHVYEVGRRGKGTEAIEGIFL